MHRSITTYVHARADLEAADDPVHAGLTSQRPMVSVARVGWAQTGEFLESTPVSP